jgi:hypothetical protein
MMMKTLVLSLVLLLPTSASASAQPSSDIVWSSLKFLVGTWVGEGTAESGQPGGGYCSFNFELDGKILVRKNHSEYPASSERPAITHDDVMIIYFDRASQSVRAFYTDNEGNVIHYSVSGDGKSAVFLGDVEPAAPRYRLTYKLTQPGHVTLTFEMAPSDKPDQYRNFVEGKLQKSVTAN